MNQKLQIEAYRLIISRFIKYFRDANIRRESWGQLVQDAEDTLKENF